MALGIDAARGKTIVFLAGPIMIAMLTQTFINVVDTIFIGKLDASFSIPGQAALGLSLPMLWIIGGSLSAVGVGTQAMTARRYGGGRPFDAGTVLFNSLVIAVVSSIIFTYLGWHLIPVFFHYLTSNEAVAALGTPYAQIRVLGVLSMVASTSYKGFFDGVGATRVHMYACLIMNAVNIPLNYVFIFGFGSIPAYFVTGAAISSLISTYVGLAIMILWSVRGKYAKPFGYYRLRNLKPRVMWEISKLSLPSMATQIFVMSGVLLFMKIIDMIDDQVVLEAMAQTNYYGTSFAEKASALHAALMVRADLPGRVFADDWAHTVLWSRPPIFMTAAKLIIDLLSIGFVTCIAFGQATATLVSQAMGKNDFKLAENYGWESVKLGMYFFGALGVVVIVFPEYFLDILSDDVMVIEAAIPGLRLMASTLMFIAMSLILIQALFGAGDTKFVMWVELILHGVCLAPLAFILAVVLNWGYMGVWISAMVYITALAMIMAWKFWSGGWKSIEV
ncbi:MAG: MATE family efflux transporter [Bradymonadaceae bacterium]|nr:MATE family efflux transporter [Lujinxingiaceae bacterium]